ncbi:prepilin-type N-terminal cleavage/methylation domain-containing protein [Lysobacter sp. TY2-98]|uniref:type II secretion system protein XpsI n=1 Tax=Lysobacter sp. TY2-98 TaxID=2290922 RepID=UPI000E205A73|nr:prepilin-type N-terminal cleavage/methylation domain-containing protein [Lysobacter sp. TY2-98]AXK70933.1 prepilin-type N-terminal cleavage/methylation domain-containing protein [Lysobacter sp. TY2-98]
MRRLARGYTLIEVIVAFAILAVALTLLLGTLTNSTKQVRWSADAGRAAMLAQSVLDRVDTDGPLREGERDGELEDGRYRWQLHVAPYRTNAPASAQPVDPNAPVLLSLDLVMQWGEGGPRERLELHSLRLVPANLGAPPT